MAFSPARGFASAGDEFIREPVRVADDSEMPHSLSHVVFVRPFHGLLITNKSGFPELTLWATCRRALRAPIRITSTWHKNDVRTGILTHRNRRAFAKRREGNTQRARSN